nr:DUF2493 domain-containing protein [uncultured Roseateles sp.]
MRTIIAGSRNINDPDEVEAAIKASGFAITVVLSGCAPGVDLLGEMWARKHGLAVERFPADWDRYGRSAGPKRNMQMATAADALIAVWDGWSPDTRNMLECARLRGLEVYTHKVKL